MQLCYGEVITSKQECVRSHQMQIYGRAGMAMDPHFSWMSNLVKWAIYHPFCVLEGLMF